MSCPAGSIAPSTLELEYSFDSGTVVDGLVVNGGVAGDSMDAYNSIVETGTDNVPAGSAYLIRPVQVSSPWEDHHQLEILFPNCFTVGSAVINLADTSIRMSQKISQ